MIMNGKIEKYGTAVSVRACEPVMFGKEPSTAGDEGGLEKFGSCSVF